MPLTNPVSSVMSLGSAQGKSGPGSAFNREETGVDGPAPFGSVLARVNETASYRGAGEDKQSSVPLAKSDPMSLESSAEHSDETAVLPVAGVGAPLDPNPEDLAFAWAAQTAGLALSTSSTVGATGDTRIVSEITALDLPDTPEAFINRVKAEDVIAADTTAAVLTLGGVTNTAGDTDAAIVATDINALLPDPARSAILKSDAVLPGSGNTTAATSIVSTPVAAVQLVAAGTVDLDGAAVAEQDRNQSNLAAARLDGEPAAVVIAVSTPPQGVVFSNKNGVGLSPKGETAKILGERQALTDVAEPTKAQLMSGDKSADAPLTGATRTALLNPANSEPKLASNADTLFDNNMDIGDVELPKPELKSTSTISTNFTAAGAITAPTTSRMNIPLNMHFGQQQWPNAVAERAAWMVSQQINSAEIQLDPPELGPLQIRVHVHQDQAVVHFVSGNAQVREALDATAARLRDMLQEQGLTLADTGVSDHSAKQGHNGQQTSADSNLTEAGIGRETTGEDRAASLTSSVPWGIDYFA